MNKLCSLLLLTLLSFAACSGPNQGGTEFGNPTRELRGEVVSEDPSALMKFQSADCPVDGVVATSPSASTIQADMEADCSFVLDLPVGVSYLLAFTRDGSFLANLTFARAEGGGETNVFYVSSGTGAIDLGVITLASGAARPANNPLRQSDRNGDGLDDFEDEDDDGDGIHDENESDCDEDGFEDDEDECGEDDNSGSGSDDDEDEDDGSGSGGSGEDDDGNDDDEDVDDEDGEED